MRTGSQRSGTYSRHQGRSIGDSNETGTGFPADYVLGIEYSMLSSADAKARKNCRKFVQTERLNDGTGCEAGKSAGRLYSERTITCQPIESLRLHVRLHPS